MKNLNIYKAYLAQQLVQVQNEQHQVLSLIQDSYKREIYQSELNSYHAALSVLDKAVEEDLQKQNQPNPQLDALREQYKNVPHLLKMAEKTYGHEPHSATRRAVMYCNTIIQGFQILKVPLVESPK